MNGKVYTIMSLVPQNGAKYIATNLGYYTKKAKKDKKILLIDFDFNTPTLGKHFIKENQANVDDLVHLKNNLTKDLLAEKISKTNLGFDILKGTNMQDKNFIEEDLIVKILIFAKEMYTDVFVVMSPDMYNSNVIVTILNSDKLILVLRNNYSNELKLMSFVYDIKPYIKEIQNLDIVLNYRDYNHSLRITDIFKKEDIQINHIHLLDFDDKTIDNTNLEEKSIFKRSNKNTKTFKKICKDFL